MYQNILGQRLMIDFVVISLYLRWYVLDTQVKRGAELSNGHLLVESDGGRGCQTDLVKGELVMSG